MTQRTELQIIVQALTALQYETRALALVLGTPVELSEIHQLRADAKALMQSAQVGADLLAFLKQTQEVGVQIKLVEPTEPRDPPPPPYRSDRL